MRFIPEQPDPILDGLALVATRIFGARSSWIALLVEGELQVVGSAGFPGPRRIARSLAYHHRVLTTEKALVLLDPHGKEDGIQFYAGQPLFHTDGALLGLIVVYDTAMVEATAEQIHSLSLIAAHATARIESWTLEQDLAALRTSVSTLCHEIRTPLNAMLGAASILERELTTAAQQELLTALQGSGQILLQLLNESLERSKSSRRHTPQTFTPIELPKFLQSVVRNLEPLAHSFELSLLLDCAGDVPEIYFGDPLRLNQILQNLLGNALKFTPSGGKVFVSCNYVAGSHSLRIDVVDNGPGIEPALLGRIFEPYVQGPPNPHRKIHGTGLGLGIARDLARALGGNLTVSSEPGNGVTATVELPVNPASAPSENVRVLLVEDEPVSRFVATRMLSMLGYQVETASNGVEALHSLETKSFDIVLMDSVMPLMDGPTTVRKIRAAKDRQWYSIPIIALTGQTSPEDHSLAFEAGVNAVLEKPIELLALQMQLRNTLSCTDV